MRDRLSWIASLAAASTLYIASPATAAGLQFTWDPAGSVPALAGPGAAVTADTIFTTGYLTDVGQPDGTGAAHQISVVTGFSLAGNPVLPVGFGTLYGLYFDETDTHTVHPPPDILHFSSFNVILKADPGNNNGLA